MRNTHVLPPLSLFMWIWLGPFKLGVLSSSYVHCFLLQFMGVFTSHLNNFLYKIHCSLVYACLLSINSRSTVMLVFRGREMVEKMKWSLLDCLFFLTGLLVWHHSTCGCWVIGCRMKCRGTLRGHVDSVNGIMWQLYTSIICTASSDKTVSLWDARSSLCVQTFYGHKSSCNHAAFDKKVYSYWLLCPFGLHFSHFAPLVSVVGWCIFKTSWTRNLTENSSP
jgi:hypothetical protein